MMSQLGNALFTATQQHVLALLYAHPERSFYTKEILRLTGMGVATIKRELDRMLQSGILTMTKIGNQHHYQANPACPIYHELLSIVRKTFGIADVLNHALLPIQSSVLCSFVFGSIAKNSDKAASDIDLMVVGENLGYADLMGLLEPVEQQLARTVNPTIYTLEDFKAKLKGGNSFLNRVMEQEKIIVMGSEDDIK